MPQDPRSEAVELERPRPSGKKRRRSLRRALTMECNVECDAWEGSLVLQASDVSDEGLWIDTPYALEQGEELVVSFPLPGEPHAERVWAIAEVARVGMWRRRRDAYPAGMGLVFTYCSQEDLNRLCNSLYGRPPRLPSALLHCGAPPPALPARGTAREQDQDKETALVQRPSEVEARGSAREPNQEEPSLPAVLDWLLANG